MTSQQFQRVLLHARFELDRFDTALLRLESHQFPSDVATTLINDQKRESQKAVESLLVIEQDFPDDPVGASARLVSEYRKLMSRRQYLEVLEKARSDEVPWSLVPSIESLAREVLPGRSVLMTTTPNMNYMVSWSRSPCQPVVTVYLPKLHRGNGFLHVLIGHELFHPAIGPFFPGEKAIVTPKLHDECRTLLATVDGEPDLFSQKRLDAVLKYALEAWERGLTELMCDMGAASLFGPAALWTISGFAASQDLDTPPSGENQFYPAWRLRVQVVLDYILQIDHGEQKILELCASLRKASLGKYADAITRSLDEERQVCPDGNWRRMFADNPFMSKVYEHVIESVKRARDFIHGVSEKINDRWTNTCDQCPALLKRLELLVPPSELIEIGKRDSQAAEMSAIVLSCWIERLVAEQGGTFELNDYRRLCRLMLKAIEDAELKRQFAQWGQNK